MAGYRLRDGILDTSDFDNERYPIPPKRVERSVSKCVHTPQPEGYNEWREFARLASRTHRQVRCPRCGLWQVWLPKAEAKAINRADDKAAREFCEAYERFDKDRR